MKKLFTIVAFLISSQFGKTVFAQGPIADTTIDEQNPGQNINFLQGYRHNAMPVAVAKQLQQNAYENSTFKIRLDSIQKDVQLDYNEYVQSFINSYTSPNRRAEMARIMGLSKYYFPIYEKAFRDAGVPEEIKFLSIVESALNPNAISRVGAAGPWQFMYSTAKLYGLNINNYVDERRDPIQASYAAAAYLKDAYQEFGDWLLAIASYNCGKGNVERAMQQANATDFWSIREYLPVETRGYVPAYIATAYVMNYYNEHGIMPQACNMKLKTDTVLVNKFVSINNIARVLDIDANELALLNPAYTKRIVNGTPSAPRRMVIPQLEKAQYSTLYDALNSDAATVRNAQPVYAALPDDQSAAAAPKLPSFHTVKRGETLSGIADRYGVEIQDLKDWNHLRNSKAMPGQRLKVSAGNLSVGKTKQSSNKDYITYNRTAADNSAVMAN
ncbi:transglycosylase SLT domain-containing protein [Mucilaginibacter sp. Bleaf8]|uniref:lytic transglycosylase domain-containing protein n=1 Tax=Mucilaginibacter sp. Bleaf8 TaxID=2834430 RepID=UPI001BCCE02B|nr:lytic transglycosylase domain-containing protein [Mucilaginibacter sp. Bleaf8]MBS7566061.1 transglycosylase SLT domain-containing protein [Mucilaginibacter sp. Bleaf8]